MFLTPVVVVEVDVRPSGPSSNRAAARAPILVICLPACTMRWCSKPYSDLSVGRTGTCFRQLWWGSFVCTSNTMATLSSFLSSLTNQLVFIVWHAFCTTHCSTLDQAGSARRRVGGVQSSAGSCCLYTI